MAVVAYIHNVAVINWCECVSYELNLFVYSGLSDNGDIMHYYDIIIQPHPGGGGFRSLLAKDLAL